MKYEDMDMWELRAKRKKLIKEVLDGDKKAGYEVVLVSKEYERRLMPRKFSMSKV